MNLTELKNLTDRDKKYVWHPLTQHKIHPDTLAISRARGALLYDEEGRSYIDGISSWYTCVYGHCHPYITEKVTAQMNRLDQVVFSGFTHEPAVELAESLLALLPSNQTKIFYSDNGSTAVEVGIKMALQYHANKGAKRKVLLAFEDGFHGDTFGAMSVSGLSVYNGPFSEFFLEVERIPVPEEHNLESTIKALEKRLLNKDVAGFIYEPLVQGAAAMKMHSARALSRLLEVVKAHGVITIADEVMTGFGKTGTYFASDQLGVQPDIICLSKALTAGLLPMGATSCTQQIYDAFYSDDLSKGLFHGHTYTANPLACTAALAGLELLQSVEMQEQITRIIQSHRDFSTRISKHPAVGATRQCGVIFAVDLNIPMERYGHLRDRLYRYFMDKGVYLRPLGNTIYTLPPYCITESQLQQVYESISGALDIL